MFIDMRAIDYSLTDPIKARAQARVNAALAGAGDAAYKVLVRFQDVNADRGGVDKRCQIVVALCGRAVAVADAIHTDLYAAIDKAARRVRRILRRTTARQRSRRRRAARDASMPLV